MAQTPNPDVPVATGATSARALLSTPVVYDGEGYSREGLQNLVTAYQSRHKQDLKSLAELSATHDALAAEMSKDLEQAKSAWEHVRNIFRGQRMGANLRGLIGRIPLLGAALPQRSLGELLEEKVEVAQRRVQQVGNHLDVMGQRVVELQADITRLNKRMVLAAQNEELAARHVLGLEAALTQLDAQLQALGDDKSAEARELQATRDEIRKEIWQHGARLRLYSNAEDRLASIVRMNNNFLEILTNLHGNMQSLFDAGNEVLSELEGNLAGLATAARASDLTLEMHNAMESLKTSVNKVTVLASETSLYLTRNVDRLTSQMKIYDDETQRLVESNLAAEREVKEQRIDETIDLARKEYGHFEEARRSHGEP